MAVSPEVLLDAATALGSGNSKVDCRNATSRAHYAAESFLRFCRPGRTAQCGGDRERPRHVDCRADRRLSPARLKGLGYMLEQSRKRRADADYRSQADFSATDRRHGAHRLPEDPGSGQLDLG